MSGKQLRSTQIQHPRSTNNDATLLDHVSTRVGGEVQFKQQFEENEKGTLEAGKLADLVVLDLDPRKVDPNAIAEIGISETWSHGERIY